MKKLFIILFLFLSFLVTYAQDADTTLLRKLVEKQVLTQQEADEIILKNQPEKTNNETTLIPQKIREAFNTPYLNFGGYALLMYKYSDVLPIKHDLNPRLVFISMNGKLYNNIGYTVLADFVNPLIHELYGIWSPSNAFNLKVGQMKVPFTIENQFSLTQLETVYNTRSISSLASMADDVMKLQNGRNNGGRDIGINASGSLINMKGYDLMEYGIGVFQGSGISSPEKDNKKDFSAQLILQPIKGFRFGGSVYFGAATYTLSPDIPVATHVRDRWALSTEYRGNRFYARAEWLHGNDGGIKKEGLYGTALYNVVPKKVNVTCKVDYYNKNKNTNAEVIDYTIGANYYFFQQCRVQLNYTYSDYSTQWGARNSNVVYSQLQFLF
ncbi:phosphate-selective porin O/P [Dysgonomonas alginatilytica]|uniref:Phosphate-selective porin O/P n=1 Tax=Dysgonomonas alginatilytica TaxID=1605892 RepID=A0A2V3PZP1_9BACT|nr:hypothetical protein [Dysgonomonas alginatilytica]PXV68005.1 phosphate-selective porin O/P [Dysgonomonas alginatilytica]